MKRFCQCLFLIWGLSLACSAQSFSTIANFSGANGSNPTETALVQATDGNFYGATYNGGLAGYGSIFMVNGSGEIFTVHSFDRTDGAYPYGGPVQALNGSLYGTTSADGVYLGGTVFELTLNGALTTLRDFATVGTSLPQASFVLGSDGNLYGSTSTGGHGSSCCGVIFKITPTGTVTALHFFSGPDGSAPNTLIQANDGNFYGTTQSGGAYGDGTVFEMGLSGSLTTLYNFSGIDGAKPLGALVQADGYLYGTTSEGGANGDGTVFRITFAGALTTLHSFDNSDGSNPNAGLIWATNDNFYGTTYGGGNGSGTIFRITIHGYLSTIHSFDGTDGANPDGGLLQATDGNIYGTTRYGGTSNDGVVFRVSLGLNPFVQLLPESGTVGSTVNILGTDLTGASQVTFHGKAASFTLVSPTQITATVPTGATSGEIQVTLPNATLSSNEGFQVTQ